MSAAIQHADVQRRTYGDVSTSGFVIATDDLSTNARVLAAAKAGHTIYVQRITLSIVTDNAATQAFQDSAGTPLVAVKTKASPGAGAALLYDFGAEGLALTEGKELDLKNSGAGLAYAYTVEAYRKRTAVGVP